jgi:primosomal protein N' (replication factor Y)
MSKKIIIDVAPITRLPLFGSQFFSYLHNQKLTPGTLVSVPFLKKEIKGITLKNHSEFHRFKNIKLKKISAVLEENFLDKNQLELAQFISNYYFSPLGIILKAFIPKRVKTRNPKPEIQNLKSKKINLTKDQNNAVKKIVMGCGLQIMGFLLYGPSGSGKTEVYINAIKKIRKKNKTAQFLILLPELTLTPQAVERYGAYFKKSEIALLHSKLSKGKFYANWQKIKSGKARIIIGTRLSVFAPFQNLKLIIIDEEHDTSFKQWDMNPRYDARTVAEKLAEIHTSVIVRGSSTPSLKSFYEVYSKKYNLLKLSRLTVPNIKYTVPDAKIELIDMKKERWQNQSIGGYSVISKKLKSEISYALKNKQQIILFVNRQGMSVFSVCTNCKTILKCPRCDRALIYENSGIYRCMHCNHKTSITPNCIKCQNMHFKNIGLGTQKIEREIISLFPDAKIARADSQSMQNKNAQENLYMKLTHQEIDILIGTQMISKGLDLPSLALIGIIDADNMLSLPDFSVFEWTFQLILQVAGRTSRPGAKFPGIVLVQTFTPEREFFKLISEKNLEKFYAHELEERRNLQLPPFGKLIKLLFQDYNKHKVISETNRIYTVLRKNNVDGVSEPQDAFLPNIRGYFRKQIIIKLSENISEDLKKLFKSLPNGWIIDIDPISIL